MTWIQQYQKLMAKDKERLKREAKAKREKQKLLEGGR
tara:strand:+ start:58 stop:168 length:111 start_codon:yes stop_codon:yes gene_type:complete